MHVGTISAGVDKLLKQFVWVIVKHMEVYIANILISHAQNFLDCVTAGMAWYDCFSCTCTCMCALHLIDSYRHFDCQIHVAVIHMVRQHSIFYSPDTGLLEARCSVSQCWQY